MKEDKKYIYAYNTVKIVILPISINSLKRNTCTNTVWTIKCLYLVL